MKEIKYGNLVYYQPENHYESNQTRLVEMHKYVFVAQYGCTTADFIEHWKGFKTGFNNSQLADAFEYMLNMEKNAMNIELGFDPGEHLHALILFTKEELEKPGSYDWVQSTYLMEKIKNMREEGITPIQISEVVQFFFLKSYPYFKSGSLKVFRYLTDYLTAYYELGKIAETLEQTLRSQKEKKN